MVARRTVLGVSAGLLVGTAVEVASAATTDGVSGVGPARGAFGARLGPGPNAPRTLAAWRTLSRGRLRVPEASFGLTHLGITWRGTGARVRLRRPSGWTGWTVVAGCGGGPDGRGRGGGAALITATDSIGYEVTVGGSGTANITELNTAGGSGGPTAGMPLPDWTRSNVAYLPRSAWGADESLRYTGAVEVWPAEYQPVQVLTIHHSAGANNDPDPGATVRAIYFYQSVTLGWGDIGYHLLIDEAGRVYEGRASGGDAAPAFGAAGPDGRPQMVVAGHVLGNNVGNIGVCLLGTLSGRQPTAAARASLVRVLVGLATQARLDPSATAHYRNPETGATRTVGVISGHRNWANTQCPGDAFSSTLPKLRTEVATGVRRLISLPPKRSGGYGSAR